MSSTMLSAVSLSHQELLRDDSVTLAVFHNIEANENPFNDHPMPLSSSFGQCFSSGKVRPDASHSTVATANEYFLPAMVMGELRQSNHDNEACQPLKNEIPPASTTCSLQANAETSSVGSRCTFEVKLPVVFGVVNV